MKMRFKVYRVSISCYPRCQHALRVLKQLSGRYIDLQEECAFENRIPASTEPMVYLCLQISDKGRTLEIEDIVKRKGGYECIDTVEYENAEDLIREKKHLMESCFVLVMNENVSGSDIPQNENVNTIIVSEKTLDIDELPKSHKVTQKVHISSKDLVGDTINDSVEQYLFEAFQMKTIWENLITSINSMRKVDDGKEKGAFYIPGKPKLQFQTQSQVKTDKNIGRKENTNRDSSQKRSKSASHIIPEADACADSSIKRSLSAQYRRPDDLSANVRDHDHLQERSTTNGILQTLDGENVDIKTYRAGTSMIIEEKDTLQTNDKGINGRKRIIQEYTYEQIERIQRLCDEITGMFARSRVPKDKQPQFDKHCDGTVSDMLKQDLRQLGKFIRGCGYRFRSLQVFVDHECDPETVTSKVEKILKKHNISRFTIVPTHVKELTSCKVGSEVQAKFDDGAVKGGTLGGFGTASSDKGKKTICLVSRHVVTDTDGNPASAVNILNGENVIQTSIMVDTSLRDRETVLDIAAVSLIESNFSLDTNYKTSEQMIAQGRLSSYSPEQMKGLAVHLCGSSTPMGYGTVTVPSIEGVRDNGMDAFIIIEPSAKDSQEEIPFCEKGDSGSIVCADDQDNPDNVQLISMLMGENLGNLGTYFSLNLGKGITQVEEETKSKIELS